MPKVASEAREGRVMEWTSERQGDSLRSMAHGGDGGDEFSEGCPVGEVARGHAVMDHDSWVSALGLICGAPGLTAL